MRSSIHLSMLGIVLLVGIGLARPTESFAQTKLTLHPSGFGEHSYAAWKAKEGQEDSEGEGDHALYFQKETATETFAAGIAIITGLKGQPVGMLTGLSWEHREDGHCGAGAPRWNVVVVGGVSGQRHTIFLGCAAAAHSPGSETGWMRDSYPGPAIQGAIVAQLGPDAVGATIHSLGIWFDEGTTQFGLPSGHPPFVHLDNITVNTHVWTGPMDNAR